MTMAPKYDKVNFLYRNPSSIYSPYMYFEGLRRALERNGLLHYAYDVTGPEAPDLKELVKYPILCITGSSPPLFEVVSYLKGKQFLADICPESFRTSQGCLKEDHHLELQRASELFDLYLTPVETDLEAYWGKPCYWIPSWAHTEILGDHYAPTIMDKIGFIGQKARRKEFFARDTNGILLPASTPPQQSAELNLAQLCRAINAFAMLANPESDYVAGMPGKIFEIAACNRLCFSQLNEETMFRSRLLFEEGRDAVYFKSFEELEEKFRYYLQNPAQMERIALAGFHKVRQFHNADLRARQIVERVLHHANGGGFDPGFNEVARFAPPAGESRGCAPVAKPFMDETEIASIRSALQLIPAGADVLEWGSGNSTLYFSRHLAPDSSWVAIEHNDGWAEQVDGMIRQQGRENVSLHMVPPDAPFIDGVEDGSFHSFRRYVLTPTAMERRFGLILVDGRARVSCMAVGWPMLDADGFMVLHDAQRTEYHEGIPAGAFCLMQRHPRVYNGPDNIVTLFMAKKEEPIARLHAILAQSIPGVELELFRFQGREEPAAPPTPPAAASTPRGSAPSAVLINTYYGAFLASFYRDRPELESAGYTAQLEALQGSLFGDSDFYSGGLARQGWRCHDLIVNCAELQTAWARENGFSGTLPEIAAEQVRRLAPDLVYIQDLNLCSGGFLALLRPHAGLIAGQIASPLPSGADLKGLDLIVSSFPHFVERFRQAGITSYYQPLAFDPRVLDAVPRLPFEERPIPCSFVGGLTPMHGKGYQLMEHLARTTPIEFWGYGAETLPADSPILPRHHGEVWGKAMFGVLASSRITVNRHIDVAERFANNMRLFEATGCGALLITDYKENLDQLFEVGTEVVAYRSEEECAALISYYLENPGEAAAIALAGQRRTLKDHSYALRMAQSAEFLQRQLRHRREAGAEPVPERISDGYRPITPGEITPELTSAWQDPAIPARQRALVQRELSAMYRGQAPLPYQVLARALGPVLPAGGALLEIGCASGYYYEVLEYLLNRRIDYTGVDYSEAMIAMAREYYTKAEFFAADGASLFFADRSFHTVISSCVLLHVPNYREHIFETARVAREYVVAARTPVCRRRPTQYLRKCAYGVETVELVFNEAELLREFELNGFRLAGGEEYCGDADGDQYLVTYLLKRH